MPKIVDHDQRRRELVEATWRVIASKGLDSTTTREIAKEAGYSNGVLAHYFGDKEEILDMALTVALERNTARLHAAADGLTGVAALRQVLLNSLPLDTIDHLATRVAISFWDRPDGGRAQGTRRHSAYRQSVAVVRKQLRAAQAAGEIGPEVDVELTTTLLAAVVDGICVQAVVRPREFSPRKQRAIVEQLIDLISK